MATSILIITGDAGESYECLYAQHRLLEAGLTPVVAVTARTRQLERERCLASGVDDFISKPIAAAHLWAALERVHPRSQGKREP